MPKPNAYQSLHTSVIGPEGQPFEVQIRTRDMDEIAERGHRGALALQGGQGAQRRTPSACPGCAAWWRGTRRTRATSSTRSSSNLYPEEVYTFTPKGEVFAFPRGATPIDFAYRVHTEVGHHCVGARINGTLVPLRTALSNGDIVEILTSPNQVPSRDWLEIAVTARAKNKIRAWLNRGEKEQAVEAGKQLLERECRKLGLSLKQLREDERLAQIARGARLRQGGGPSRGDRLRAHLARVTCWRRWCARAPVTPAPARQGPRRPTCRRGRSSSSRGSATSSRTGRSAATRCPGDEIVGYITRGRGVAVHAANCPNVRKLLFTPEREVEVEWGGRSAGVYSVPLHVTFEDRPGMLAAISQAATGEDANIRSCHLSTNEASVGHRGPGGRRATAASTWRSCSSCCAAVPRRRSTVETETSRRQAAPPAGAVTPTRRRVHEVAVACGGLRQGSWSPGATSGWP